MRNFQYLWWEFKIYICVRSWWRVAPSLSCVSLPAASLQTFSNQIFSADFPLKLSPVRRMSYFLLLQICVEQGRLVEEMVVSECVPEPVPLAYVTTVLPAAGGGGGGGGGLPHHPLPQLRTLRSTWQHALQAALHPPARPVPLLVFPMPWCNTPDFEAAATHCPLSCSPAATIHGDVTFEQAATHTWTTCWTA